MMTSVGVVVSTFVPPAHTISERVSPAQLCARDGQLLSGQVGSGLPQESHDVFASAGDHRGAEGGT